MEKFKRIGIWCLPLTPFLVWWVNDFLLVYASTIVQAPKTIQALATVIATQKILIPILIYGLLLFASQRHETLTPEYRRNASAFIGLLLIVDIFVLRGDLWASQSFLYNFAKRHDFLMETFSPFSNQKWVFVPMISLVITALSVQGRMCIMKKLPSLSNSN